MKSGFLLLFFIFILLTGCRDYLNDINDELPPVLVTDALNYNVNDSILVTLKNNSNKVVYTMRAISYLEVKTGSSWTFYYSFACINCSELSIVKDQSLTLRTGPLFDTGTYRFVCLYSNSAGTAPENKIKLYSNEFIVE